MPQTLNDVDRATVVRLLQRHRPEPGRACLPPGCSCGHEADHDEHLAALIVEALSPGRPSTPEPVVVGSATYVTRGGPPPGRGPVPRQRRDRPQQAGTGPAVTPDDLGLLTVNEAAHVAGVSPATVRVWIHRAGKGTLTDEHGRPLRLRTQRSPRGRLLVAEADLLDVEEATRVKAATRGGRRRTVAA